MKSRYNQQIKDSRVNVEYGTVTGADNRFIFDDCYLGVKYGPSTA